MANGGRPQAGSISDDDVGMETGVPTAQSQLWFWNGKQWCPLSPDGLWNWDGERWNPTPPGSTRVKALDAPRPKMTDRLKNLPRWLIWRWVAWTLFLVAWVPIVEVPASHHVPATTLGILGCCFGGAAVVSTVAFGSSLGHRRAWGYLAWSILVGAAVLGLLIFMTFSSSVPANQDNPGVGIGAMFVTVICVIPMTILLYAGGGLGALRRRLIHRPIDPKSAASA